MVVAVVVVVSVYSLSLGGELGSQCDVVFLSKRLESVLLCALSHYSARQGKKHPTEFASSTVQYPVVKSISQPYHCLALALPLSLSFSA